jgi:hypothetical protein
LDNDVEAAAVDKNGNKLPFTDFLTGGHSDEEDEEDQDRRRQQKQEDSYGEESEEAEVEEDEDMQYQRFFQSSSMNNYGGTSEDYLQALMHEEAKWVVRA